jgi:hypothetical protein
MRRWMKISLICVSVIILLLLLSMLIVPWQVKKQGASWVAENTSRTLSIEKAFFNPVTLTLELTNVDLSEQDSDKSFVAFSRLLISVSSRSLIDWALIFDRVELDDPYVNIERLTQAEFNFSDFADTEGAQPQEKITAEAEEQKDFHFSFNNIILKNGSVDFSDRALAVEAHHEIRQLDLSVPFIGNVPYLTDIFVEPALFMLLNGAEVKASGQLKPFHDTLATELDISLHGVDLAFYAAQSPIELPIQLEQGELDFYLGLSYQVLADKVPQLLLTGQCVLSDLIVNEPIGTRLFLMPSLILDLAQADVFTQTAHFLSIDLHQPELFVTRDNEGLLNLQRLFTSDKGAAPKMEAEAVPSPSTAEPTALPLISVDSFTLHQGQIHYRDAALPASFVDELQPIDLKLEQLSTHPEQLTNATLSFADSYGLEFNLDGQFGLTPLQAEFDVATSGFELSSYSPYLAAQLNHQLEGRAELTTHLSYRPDGNLLADQFNFGLYKLLVPFDDRDQFNLASFNLSGASFDLQQQSIAIDSIALNGGDLDISRLLDGSLSPLQLLKEQPATQAAEAAQTELTTDEKQTQPAPWMLRLDDFDLSSFKLKFTDYSDPREPALRVADLKLQAANLSWPEAGKSPFQLNATLGDRGAVSIDGSMIHTPLQLSATTQIKALALADLNDFIPRDLQLKLQGGNLYTTLKTDLEQRGDRLSGSFSGDTSITGVNLADPLGNGELLSWKALNLNTIQGEIAPFALHIAEVSLNDYTANIVISEEGKINLSSVTAEEAQSKEDPEETPEPAQEIPETSTVAVEEKAATDIRIDAVTLQGGTVSFIDRHMPNTFSTTMYQLGGRVSGLASDPEMQADVDLRGQLENHSPLTISGKLNPLSKDLFAALTFSFNEIDLTPLTPYSGTYLGYVIDKGKLNLDLDYHIEHQQINADNRVMIDQFTFGDTVKSDKATSLPVSLAIALLKDGNGEIHLDIPVSGNLNDPSFSIGGTVWTIVRNLLLKAATSPFALLSALAGGDEDFSSLPFANGLAELSPEQAQKASKLAKILTERPGLTLEIHGFADAEMDPEAYRLAQLNDELLQAKAADLENAGTTPESSAMVAIATEEYPDLLWQIYKEAEFPRPRNALGMLQKLPPEEMEKLLLANIIVGEEQLAALAQKRALVVRTALEKINPELKSRLFLTSGDIYQKAQEGPSSRVEFSIQAK